VRVSSSFDEQEALAAENLAEQHAIVSANVLTPIEEVVPSIYNPLTSSESFFLVDSSGRQRKGDFQHIWPIILTD
jgi:hypothetical protein